MGTSAIVLADHLERALSDEAPLADAFLSSPEFGRDLEPVVRNLHHFFADADIRASDATYRAMQLRSMRRLISLLKQGAPAEQLAQISFLGEPE